MDNQVVDPLKIQITKEELVHEIRKYIASMFDRHAIHALCETLYQLIIYIKRKRAEDAPEFTLSDFMLQGFIRYVQCKHIDIDYLNTHGGNPRISGDSHKYAGVIQRWVRDMLADAYECKLDDFETQLLVEKMR